MNQTTKETKGAPIVAWTGGDAPAKPSKISAAQAGVQKYLFGAQVMEFSGYWGDAPNWDTLRLFFRRARYDAHATQRATKLKGEL